MFFCFIVGGEDGKIYDELGFSIPSYYVPGSVADDAGGSVIEHDPAVIWFERSLAGGDVIDGVYYDTKACLQQTLFYKPENAQAWVQLGYVGGGLVNGTEYGEKACYAQALECKPHDATAWYNLGVKGGGLVSGTEYDKKACYLQALSHKPDYVKAMVKSWCVFVAAAL